MVSAQDLQNAAVIQDGIELDFRGDRCGNSYRIKRDSSLNRWACYFNDCREGGFYRINRWPGEEHRSEAIGFCNQHATKTRLLKFLPTRPRLKATWGGWGMAAASQIAVLAGLGL